MDLLVTLSPLLVAFLLLVLPWVTLAVLAARYGVDSRLGLDDDRRRGATPTGWI